MTGMLPGTEPVTIVASAGQVTITGSTTTRRRTVRRMAQIVVTRRRCPKV